MCAQRNSRHFCRLAIYFIPLIIAVAGGNAASAQSSHRIVTAVEKHITPGNVAFVDTVGKRIVEINRGGKVVWNWSIPAFTIGNGDLRLGADLSWIAQDDSFLLVIPLRGVFRINRAGKVVWQHLTPKISHDADLLPNGNVLYVLGWDAPSDAQVYEVDPKGKLVWSWNAKGKIDEAWHNPEREEDRPSYGHTNAAARLADGDTIVSLRNFNRVFRVAPSGDVKQVWGPIGRVHEPTLLPDGGLVAAQHAPRPGAVIFVRDEGRGRPIFRNELGIGPIRTVEVLKDGNYLITGGEEILEIDADGAIVWHAQIYPKDEGGRGQSGRGEEGRRRGESRGNPGQRGVYKAVWVGRGS